MHAIVVKIMFKIKTLHVNTNPVQKTISKMYNQL